MATESRLTIDDRAKNAANAWWLGANNLAQTVADAATKAIKDGDADKPDTITHLRYLLDNWQYALEQLAQAKGQSVPPPSTPTTPTLNVEVGNMRPPPMMTPRKRRPR